MTRKPDVPTCTDRDISRRLNENRTAGWLSDKSFPKTKGRSFSEENSRVIYQFTVCVGHDFLFYGGHSQYRHHLNADRLMAAVDFIKKKEIKGIQDDMMALLDEVKVKGIDPDVHEIRMNQIIKRRLGIFAFDVVVRSSRVHFDRIHDKRLFEHGVVVSELDATIRSGSLKLVPIFPFLLVRRWKNDIGVRSQSEFFNKLWFAKESVLKRAEEAYSKRKAETSL